MRLSPTTDFMRGLKDNQAVSFESGNKTYVFWNFENGRLLISDYWSELPNYYSIERLGRYHLVIHDKSFEKTVKRMVPVDSVSTKIFSISIRKIQQERNVISEKV